MLAVIQPTLTVANFGCLNPVRFEGAAAGAPFDGRASRTCNTGWSH